MRIFVLIYPTDCLCDVISMSYFSSLLKQLCIMIVCFFFLKLSLDIKFRMMGVKSGLVISDYC